MFKVGSGTVLIKVKFHYVLRQFHDTVMDFAMIRVSAGFSKSNLRLFKTFLRPP